MRQLLLGLLMILTCAINAQTFTNDFGSSATNNNSNRFDRSGNPIDSSAVNDSRQIPIGLSSWTIDNLGNINSIDVDTLQHHFQNSNETSGYKGYYSYLGNLGTPRFSHVFFNRIDFTNEFFTDPYSLTIRTPYEVQFTNTKSPFVNLTYYTFGGNFKQEERFKAYYATNVNRHMGFGFNIDYIYGRGQYANQQNAQFDGNLFAYYLGDKYNMHFTFINANIKQTENGGITDDRYVTNPLEMAEGRKTYETENIPTRLKGTWNHNTGYHALLTHRYNLGFYRQTTEIISDSTKTTAKDTIQTEVFVPVTSFIHTVKLDTHTRKFIGKSTADDALFAQNYFTREESDKNQFFNIENTLAISLREGFNKWAKAGLTAYARHEFRKFTLPDTLSTGETIYGNVNEQNLVIGGELAKRNGHTLHYLVNGELPILGTNIGEFKIEGKADLNIKLFNDTVRLESNAYMRLQKPVFYFGTMRTRHAWWDYTRSKTWRTRIEGSLTINRWGTRITAGIENIKNYAYFERKTQLQEQRSLLTVGVGQSDENIQILSASLKQDLSMGIFHLDNEITYQRSSNNMLIPLPEFSLYHNLYLKFALAKKVLNVELGADVRYFSRYYAPDYAPEIGQYVLQNFDERYLIGGYPLTSIYLNVHLKRTRFFLAYYNATPTLGNNNYFMVPHYPLNPTGLRMGLSWNFFD